MNILKSILENGIFRLEHSIRTFQQIRTFNGLTKARGELRTKKKLKKKQEEGVTTVYKLYNQLQLVVYNISE
jgi:hypothetical protein